MITEAQRLERMKHLGSSDAPAIVGLDPFKTAGDVYYSKLHSLPISPNDAMLTGIMLEPVILDYAELQLGKLRRDVEVFDLDYPQLAANMDGMVIGVDQGVEAKYVGIKSEPYWGEPGTDAVPDHVAIQVQHQMYVANLSRVHVAAAIIRPFRGLVFEMFCVERDDDLLADLITAELAFWKNNVLARVPPTYGPASFEILKRLTREPKSVVILGDEAAQLWEDRLAAGEFKKSAEEDYDRITSKILEALGPFEAGSLPDGSMIVYAEENGGEQLINSRAAKAAYPEMFKTTTRRVLRLKKGKK